MWKGTERCCQCYNSIEAVLLHGKGTGRAARRALTSVLCALSEHTKQQPHTRHAAGANTQPRAHRTPAPVPCTQTMRGKLEKTEERLSDFRDKLKDARAELASRDRQLDVAKRMLSRLGDEKKELESTAEAGRTAARKMEARLHASGEGQEATAKLGRMRAKVVEQRDELRDCEARCLLSEEAALKLSQEVSMLRRALGMKDSLADGALDSQARLLHQLALAQEESTSLARAVSEREMAMQSMEEEVEGQRGEIGRLELSRAELDAELDDARQTVAESVETSVTFRREAELVRPCGPPY
jgi:chromosome segregation ATPase